MPTGKRGEKHWAHVLRHLLLDCVIVLVGIATASRVRFGEWVLDGLWLYAPAMLVAALAVAMFAYIGGLYALHHTNRDFAVRMLTVGGALAAGLAAILVYGSIDFSARVGRGVLLFSVPLVGGGLVLHHLYLLALSKSFRERLACLVAEPSHEREAELFESVQQRHIEFVGVVHVGDYEPERYKATLGGLDDISKIIKDRQINCLLCPPGVLSDPRSAKQIRELRYSGVSVSSLADICEEVFQAMPLEFATPEWLLSSCGQSRLFYVRKLKRAFDVAVASVALLLALPLLLLAMLAVKATSRGPVFYRQERVGRFGRAIVLPKLRTMCVDAERDGARWSSVGDSRITKVGRILRKFRIDEIPQLWSVLMGRMSFVGPRPERREMIEKLSGDIPLFSERIMVQPGLTGWAQVNYPYGSTIDDAKRKLEYDLYYMKHMSVFLDFFILLDTIRIVMLGGVPKAPGKRLVNFSETVRAAMEEERLASEERIGGTEARGGSVAHVG